MGIMHMRRRRMMVAAALAALAAVGSGVPAAGAAAEADGVRVRALGLQARLVEVIERASPSVVAVFRSAPGRAGGGAGSGVLISPEGFALTNYHVVGQLREIRAGLPDGHIYAAKVVGRDPTGDIALLKLRGKKTFPHAPLGDSDDLVPGEWAIAMGNPFNLATDFKPTVTLGIVSGVNRYLRGRGDNTLIYTNCLQIDTPINPGNSGGPLFNSAGELVGINGRIAGRPTRGRVNVGAGFAISINQIKRFLPMLREGHDVYHAQLGVAVQTETPEGGGVTVETVLPDSAAAEAGLQPGDAILRFNGEAVLSRQHLINMIGVLPAGTDAVLVIARDGREEEVDVELGGLPAGRGVLAGRGTGRPVVPHSAPAMPQEAPSVQDVLAAHVKARGGRAAIDAVKGTRATGTITSFGRRKVTAKVVLLEKAPDRFRTDIEATISRTFRRGKKTVTRKQTIKETRGYDGKEGWVRNARGVNAMLGNDVTDIRRGIVQSRIVQDGERPDDVTLEYLGESTIGDRRVHVIRAKGDPLGSRWWFFDAASHLLVRTRYWSLGRGRWRIVDLADYREVGGVKMPFKIEGFSGGGMDSDVVIKTIEVKNDLPEKSFKAP